MLKKTFSVVATSALLLGTQALADLENPKDFKEPVPPSFSLMTFGNKLCEGFGIGFSKSDIILNSKRGAHYIPYDVWDEGRIIFHPAQAKYISCPA